jgi:hypothetical protein
LVIRSAGPLAIVIASEAKQSRGRAARDCWGPLGSRVFPTAALTTTQVGNIRLVSRPRNDGSLQCHGERSEAISRVWRRIATGATRPRNHGCKEPDGFSAAE